MLTHGSVDIIGAGNVATRMALGLAAAGVKIGHVASRTPAHAAALAERVGATPSPLHLAGTDAGCAMVIVAVSDDSIAPLLQSLPPARPGVVWVHTSGSVGIEAFAADRFPEHGVFYPLQTMSRTVEVDWSRVPLFTEGSSEQVEQRIAAMARRLTPHVSHLDSARRRTLHAAAVIGSNMALYLWSVASDVLATAGLDFDVMRPLLEVTLERTRTLTPAQAMTGPARRGDLNTLRRHMAALPPDAARVYATLSESILHTYHPDLKL